MVIVMLKKQRRSIVPELKIEARHILSTEGFKEDIDLTPENVEIKIFDGDKLVAKTTLESLVKKFLSISSEYMEAMAIINKIKESQENKIILPGEQNG